MFLYDERMTKWFDEKISVDKRWIEIFFHFKQEHVSHDKLKLMDEYVALALMLLWRGYSPLLKITGAWKNRNYQ